MTPGICNYDPVNGEIIWAPRFKTRANRFFYDQHVKEFDRLENLPETQPERSHPFWKTDALNDNEEKRIPLKEIAAILFIILPAGIVFLYLVIHALRQCLLGCFY